MVYIKKDGDISIRDNESQRRHEKGRGNQKIEGGSNEIGSEGGVMVCLTDWVKTEYNWIQTINHYSIIDIVQQESKDMMFWYEEEEVEVDEDNYPVFP